LDADLALLYFAVVVEGVETHVDAVIMPFHFDDVTTQQYMPLHRVRG
jgi:hypothetical protein